MPWDVTVKKHGLIGSRTYGLLVETEVVSLLQRLTRDPYVDRIVIRRRQ